MLMKLVGVWAWREILTIRRPPGLSVPFMPQTDALDRWYDRLSLSFCRPGATPADGLIFRKISSPIDGEGGFYGYQRL